MKIAIQLYGHLRTFEACAPALKKHILDHYDVDVFMHTWDQTEHSTKSWYDDSVKASTLAVNEHVLKKIEQFYAPKAIKIEAQNLFEESGKFGTHDKIQISLQGLKYMLYSQWQANKLREDYEQENHIKYDYIIVTRPDIFPFVKLNLADYEKEFEYYKDISIHFVHNSEIHIKSNRVFNYRLLGDVFYVATPAVISKIASIFQEFDYFYKKITSTFPPQVENPELAFFEAIMQKGIIPRQYINYFAIKRAAIKDDIKLLPPGELAPELHMYAETAWSKRLLGVFVQYAPAVMVISIIKLCEKFAACGRYLNRLKEMG